MHGAFANPVVITLCIREKRGVVPAERIYGSTYHRQQLQRYLKLMAGHAVFTNLSLQDNESLQSAPMKGERA
jgi:hypothetical protein